MNNDEILKKIQRRARMNQRNRLDARFLNTMGFLVAKGFLHVNYEIQHYPNKRISIKDAIWAGRNVEPRILEVLPAAILRLDRHFDFNPKIHKELILPLAQLRKGEAEGNEFMGIPYQKLKQWRDIKLQDRRTKTQKEKRVMKTYRLRPDVIAYLEKIAKEQGRTVTDCLEARILG